MGVDSNTLGSAALTPHEEIKIKKIEDATEAARNKLWNHHIYGLSLKFLKFFWFFTPNLVSKRCYVESKHSGLNKLCLLVFPEILERAEKFGLWRQVSKGRDFTIQLSFYSSQEKCFAGFLSLLIGGLLETCLWETEKRWENFLNDFRSL